MTGSATWTAIRLGGLAAWLLLGATVIVGLLAASRLLGRGVSRSSLERVHRRLGELMTVAIAVHLIALLLDQYLPFSVTDLAVPLASSWRPVAVAFGVVAAWLVVAVMVSSMLKPHLPRRVWHAIHMASYAAFGATSVHLMAAGTDAWLWPVQVLNVAMCGLVVGLAALALWRMARRRGREGHGASSARTSLGWGHGADRGTLHHGRGPGVHDGARRRSRGRPDPRPRPVRAERRQPSGLAGGGAEGP